MIFDDFILLNFQLWRKLFSIINIVGFNYIVLTCYYTYIYNQKAIFNVNGKTNLHIDL